MAVKTIRRPNTPARHPAEWVPRDIDQMSPDDAAWADQVATRLAEYEAAVQRDDAGNRNERWRLRDGLGDLLKTLATNVEQLLAERAWPLCEVCERAAGRWLHEVEQLSDVPAGDVDLRTPYYSLAEAWGKFCDPPELEQTRTVTLESLQELDRLPGIADSAVCGIFASGDPIPEDAEWGPWIIPGGLLPSPNFERLRAARTGKAQVPTTRTVTTRLPGWPTKQPVLLLLRQVAALGE